MKISDKNVSDVLKSYGVNDTIINVYYLVENYEKGISPRARVIIKVKTQNEKMYIIKFILEEEHPEELIEEQSIFSECLRANGINTAKRIKSCDKYCNSFNKDGLSYAITVEEYLGEELKFIDYNIIEEIAYLMANMHTISQKNDCHIHGNTIWDLFDETTDISRGYKAFCEYRYSGKYDFTLYDTNLYEKIIKLYERRLLRLKNAWHKLPKYATQGDYSINNLAYNGVKIEGIFDYNIAGDEVLVSDMIIEGLFVSYEMDSDNLFAHDDKDKMFKMFIEKYMKYRKLNEHEIDVMNDIYAVVFPFWWTRIIFDEENSLRRYLNDKNISKVNEFLYKTYKLLKQDYFDNDYIKNKCHYSL